MPRAALALTAAAVAWTLMLAAAPAAVTRPALTTPAAFVYAGASRICHQKPERSFQLAGRQLPVCARCFGLYVAGALGAVAAWSSRRRVGQTTRYWLGVAAVPTALTWTLEMLGVAGFTNVIRASAALPLGAAGGWAFVQLLRYDARLDGNQIDSRRPHVHGG